MQILAEDPIISPVPRKRRWRHGIGSMRTKLSTVFKAVTQDMGLTPAQINNGNCDAWADKVQDRLVGKCRVDIYEVEFCHVFVKICGLYYDAESMDGVDDYMNLPIFAKLKKRLPKVLIG